MDRTILHCDLNGFYASVACIGHPELKRVPMAVCGNPENRHGIILAKNELAKRAGVQTAETVWQAKRKCPELVLTPPHRELYLKYSQMVNEVYLHFTDMVEPFGIDESWLDVTGSEKLFGSGREIADKLRAIIKEKTGLTISVGVSFCKVFAKLGSDYKKPDATTEINRENFRRIVWPLDVGALLYVGKSAKKALASVGIHTIGELAVADGEMLEKLLGRMGEQIKCYAAGEDMSAVRRYDFPEEIKSVGNGMTFSRNLIGESDVYAGVMVLCDIVAARMRRNAVRCSTIQIQIKDPNFKTISRQKPLKRPTNLAKELCLAAMELIRSSWNLSAPIRLITVTGTGLISEEDSVEQMSLFDGPDDEKREKNEKLERAMDTIRSKYGSGSIVYGAIIGKDIFAAHEQEEGN